MRLALRLRRPVGSRDRRWLRDRAELHSRRHMRRRRLRLRELGDWSRLRRPEPDPAGQPLRRRGRRPAGRQLDPLGKLRGGGCRPVPPLLSELVQIGRVHTLSPQTCR